MEEIEEHDPDTRDFKKVHADIKVGDIVYYPCRTRGAGPRIESVRVLAIADSGRIGIRPSYGGKGRVGYSDRVYYLDFEDAKCVEVDFWVECVDEAIKNVQEMRAHSDAAHKLTEAK